MDNSIRLGISDSKSNKISIRSIYSSAARNLEIISSSETSPPDVSALRRLSENLESVFQLADFEFFTDANIILSNGREVPVHRCILSARSPFFKNLFSGVRERGTKFELKDLAKEYEVGFDSLAAVLSYLYSGKVKPLPKDVCVCVDDDCSHAACRPVIDFMVEVLYASFTFQISELVALYQKLLSDIIDKVATDDILVILSVANLCAKSCETLLAKCIEIIVKSDIDVVSLDKALPHYTVKQIVESRKELGLNWPESNSFPDKHVKRIHRALDSDDVELVRMLLKEAHSNLDDACALHYAVAYCDAKTTTDLLELGIADINRRNARGYTVLHIAAMRREPKIIVSLLTKGARPLDLTLDGKKALQISKRLTKAVDYYKLIEEGKASPRERLCVEILEQAERRDPLLGEASLSLAMEGDDLRKKLLYLENRVALAKLLFPVEAKVAMDIAQVDGTSEFTGDVLDTRSLSHSQGPPLDLNEAPFKIQEEHLIRMRALSRTVELGKRFFPRCSEVLNKIMDNTNELTQLAHGGRNTLDEQLFGKNQYTELQELLSKAFDEDKEELDKSRSSISSSSSSSSVGLVNGKLTIEKNQNLEAA